MAEDAAWVGRTIDGRYAVESMLGSGGMGVVLRAQHKFTGAKVALKMLRPELLQDPALQMRFLAEARAPNQIGHPAIVQVLDAGRTPEGELYLAMELLVGQPLRDALERPLPPSEVRRITCELLDALAAAHSRGLVHRDLKPENVFLAAPNATVKLLDFGIAKGVMNATVGLARTAAGALLGTLAYMAPEQLRDASAVDPRADLWAVGVMVYEMISTRLPFHARSIEELYMKLAKHEPDPIRRWVPTIAPAVEQFFERALARDPLARFGSAAELAAAVAQLPLELPTLVQRARESGLVANIATVAVGAPTMATGFAAQTPAPVSEPQPFPPPRSYVPQTLQTGPQPYVQTGVPPYAMPQTGPQPRFAADQTGPQPYVPPRRSHAIAYVLAGVAVIAIAVAIVIATHSNGGAPAISRAGSGSSAGSNVTAASRDATVLDCAASCSWLDTCGLRASNCVAECERTKGFGGCVPRTHDCDKFAACFLAPNCGAVGRGTASCNDTLNCQISCGPDQTCACGCAASAAPHNLSLWLAYSVCTNGCSGQADCVTRTCTPIYQRCKSQ